MYAIVEQLNMHLIRTIASNQDNVSCAVPVYVRHVCVDLLDAAWGVAMCGIIVSLREFIALELCLVSLRCTASCGHPLMC